jgi:poly-gamma-glutamate synthesis protein (capsule biosynthesis protein)
MHSFVNWLKLLGILILFAIFSQVAYTFKPKPETQSTPDNSVAITPSLAPISPSPTTQTTILFTGDIMFDRKIRSAAAKNGNDFVFAPIHDTLLKYDFVVSNLEGPVTNHASKSLGAPGDSPAHFTFTFDPSLAKTLKQNNISVVNLGNNHILNFGQEGLQQTLNYLSQAGVAAFGYAGTATVSATLPYSHIIEHEGQRIALVSYNLFIPGSEPATLAEIKKVRSQADWVVVYTHWDNEYQPIAHESSVALAHQFIDSGADMVIGSHPHVIQNHELYKDKHIYYSLGNFIFDQYFEPAVKKGLMVGVTFTLDPPSIAVTETHNFLHSNGQTSLTSE